jgi:hypothetical protein
MTNTNVGDNEQTRKDTSYSPASETETAAKQDDSQPEAIDAEAAEKVNVAPGTGGPDDVGDVEVNRSARARKRRTEAGRPRAPPLNAAGVRGGPAR